MTELGQLSCWVALLMAVWGAALSCVGALTKRGAFVASGSRGVHAAALFVTLASAGLGWALLTGDFSLRYVAAFTNEVLPLGYRLSAFWAGRAGSTLLAALLLSACVPVAVAAARRRDGAVAPWVTTALGAALALLLSALAAGAAPFGRFDVAPVDGRGLDPALQHPGMAILRPLAYLGYAATLVALAHALAAFASRRLEGPSPSGVRPWLIAAWCALGASVLLALRVGYAEPGSGGYWPWRGAGGRRPPGRGGLNVADAGLRGHGVPFGARCVARRRRELAHGGSVRTRVVVHQPGREPHRAPELLPHVARSAARALRRSTAVPDHGVAGVLRS